MLMRRIRRSMDKIFYTIGASVLLLIIILIMVAHNYSASKSEAFEMLHLTTRQIKEDLNLQMLSDRENLITMASFASELNANGEDFDIIFSSFKEIGLFENIGILLPDNTFLTKAGKIDLSGKISFEEEVKRGQYISGRVNDFTYDKRQVVRSAVPIKGNNGSTVGMLYGVINLEKLKTKYMADTTSSMADLFVIEGGTGNFLIDTKHEALGNISELSVTKFNNDYSYQRLIEDISTGRNGFTSFKSLTKGEYLYAHYAPLNFSDWQIMLMQPESVVFTNARATVNYLIFIVGLMLLVIVAYVYLIFTSEKKLYRISKNASNIRKNLLGINQEFDKIYRALKNINEFALASSSFVIDSHGEKYNYLSPLAKKVSVSEGDKNDFITFLWAYASKNDKYNMGELFVSKIIPNKKLKEEMPAFYSYLKRYNIRSITYACVLGNDATTSILGVINDNNKHTEELLRDIAICFTMAIYNQKHLVKTEEMALIDALTGAANRMAYKEDLKALSVKSEDDLTTVYVDVNELNYYNNHYGHAAGDQMLKFIADALRESFKGQRVYRMGGDEFLIFTEGLSLDEVKDLLDKAILKIEEMKYHISVGIKTKEKGVGIEDMVVAAEKNMYDAKAKYYQNKETRAISQLANRSMEADYTGIKEIDACLSAMSIKYSGVFCLSHKKDDAKLILSPSYFSEVLKETGSFSSTFKAYMHKFIRPEYHRILLNFLEYDAIEESLKKGIVPSVSYKKFDGEEVALYIYPNVNEEAENIDSIWIFEKKDK